MKILHTVEFYSPSVGGAQEVVKQISERLAARGHQVTVATTYNPKRQSRLINGVQVEQFNISGNAVRGFTGEIESYQDFLKQGKFDIMMNYAAQQWATDLVYPILDQIPYKKILIPCGFSGLYMPEYAEYFKMLPAILEKYDHLAFHADDYRDANFARQHGINRWSIMPNGASFDEFSIVDSTFRDRYGIPSDAIMLLTVGSHTGSKGHALALEALKKISADGSKVFLVIIGNILNPFSKWKSIKIQLDTWRNNFWPLFRLLQKRKFKILFSRIVDLVKPLFWGGLYVSGCVQDCNMRANRINIMGDRNKRVLLLNPPRADVVAAYHASDLFIFGSNIEYSPLVLFESMASKTPFLTLACGNAAEIVEWGKGGKIASTIKLEQGMVDGDPEVFAHEITAMLGNKAELSMLAQNGYAAWQDKFTWEKIVVQYENLYQNLVKEK
jgi:glycosyltransferase involved in cell wall biosynthesis